MIDDIDSTFINGTFIGSTNVYNKKRVYTIPAGLLKNRNTISVKVMDSGGGGGIYGESEDIGLYIGQTRVPLSGEWNYRIEKAYTDGNSTNPNAYPTLLYNAMINPLVGYGIGGALWYQGESNAGRADQYNTSFPLMINDWRNYVERQLPLLFCATHPLAGRRRYQPERRQHLGRTEGSTAKNPSVTLYRYGSDHRYWKFRRYTSTQ